MLCRMRPDTYGRIVERAQTQLGLICWRDLRSIQVSAAAFRRLPGWQPRCDHVFALAGAERTWRQDLMCALLDARVGAVATAFAGARLWGVPGYERRTELDVLVKRGGSHRLCHGRLHETFWLPPHHVAERQGVPVVAARRLPFELAPRLRPSELRWVIDFLRNERGLTIEQLALTVAELCRSGRPGSAEMRLQVEELAPGYIPPNTVLAAKYRDLCRAISVVPTVCPKASSKFTPVTTNDGSAAWT
jgi:hypothetical protein